MFLFFQFTYLYIVYLLFYCSARSSLPASSNMVERDAQPGYSTFKQLCSKMPLVVRGPPRCVTHSLNSSTCTAYVHHQTLKVEFLAQNVPTPLCFTTQSPKPKAKHCLLETLPPLAHLKCTGSARPACPDYLAVNLDWRCHFSNFTIRAHHEVRVWQDLVWRWIT